MVDVLFGFVSVVVEVSGLLDDVDILSLLLSAVVLLPPGELEMTVTGLAM